MNNATEAQAEAAIKVLKRMIEAAEASNQAGENAVVKAAAAPTMFDYIEKRALAGDQAAQFILEAIKKCADESLPCKSRRPEVKS